MGLSAVAPQFATPTPSTNSMVSNNTQPHGLGTKHNFMETGNSIHAPSHTIPAISHKNHGSSSNSGKTPLDLLLANPIKFVKTSMMQPAYKRTRVEAFGASNTVPKDKKRSAKKSPKTLSPMTLVTRSYQVGAENSKRSNTSPDSPVTKEKLDAKRRVALAQKLASVPKKSTRDQKHSVDSTSSSPFARHKKVTVLVTKEKSRDKSPSSDTTASTRAGSSRSSPSRSKSTKDKAKRSSPQAVEKSTSGSKATGRKTTVSPPPSSKKQADGVTATLDKPAETPSEKPKKPLTNGDAATLAKEIPKKRKADSSDGINPPAQKIRTDLNGNSSAKQSETNGNSLPKQISSNKPDVLQPGVRAKGFSNRMNDCYRNSVLQLFCSSAVFRREIVHHNPKRCKLSICVCCTLRQLFENHHYDTKSNARKSTNKAIPEVMRMARILPKNFKGTRQEDATEYLHAVLHTAKDQLSKGIKGDALKDNPIDKTFGGSFPSVLTCPKCHHRSYNKVDLPSLMLHPSVKPRENKAANIINLADLLNDHFKPEKVDATCEKCKYNKKKFTKQIEIEKLPEFLVLNVMRWTNTTMRGGRLGADKIMNRLKYEESIKLMEGETPVEYVLNGVVAHSGRSLSGGHYISFVKQPDGTWAECNDQMVDQTTWSMVSRAGGLQATILGYQRVD